MPKLNIFHCHCHCHRSDGTFVSNATCKITRVPHLMTPHMWQSSHTCDTVSSRHIKATIFHNTAQWIRLTGPSRADTGYKLCRVF